MTNTQRTLTEKNGRLREEYEALVNRKIRHRYTLSEELALHRKRDVDPEAFAAMNEYIEACKKEARTEIYGEEVTK